MVPTRPGRRRNTLPRTYGYIWRHLQISPNDQSPSRHSQYLCPSRPWIQWTHCLRNLPLHSRNERGWSRTPCRCFHRNCSRYRLPLIRLMRGYISRSVAGSYDNEAIAIFLLMFTFFLWIKALKTGSAFWGALTALFYFYMVAAWGSSSNLRSLT
jgi:hypothetical protein